MNVAVIDIGKTNAKVILYDLEAAAEKDVRSTRNAVTGSDPYPHFEVDDLFAFILGALAELHKAYGVDAISVTTHGATATLLKKDGSLALPVLDYEHDGPDETREAYESVRPPFAITGSPHLAVGLNIGAQLFWQKTRFPEAFSDIATVLPYPQYWGFRLTGRLASEVTSWGCHSDLWSPRAKTFSPLVEALGLEGKMAPLVRADEELGAILPEIAEKTGLSSDTPVYAGIHDSNASLLPHLWSRKSPFAVVSTGTWVVVMAVGGHPPMLDETRDTLINVNAFGDPVPSARFMGGRVFEVAAPKGDVAVTDEDRTAMLKRGVMLMPSVLGDTGPFQGIIGGWTIDEAKLTPGMRLLGVCWYLALMTGVCLELTGASGPVIVEGPFSENRDFLAMLAAATGRPVEKSPGSGTSTGTAGLVTGGPKLKAFAPHPEPLHDLDALNRYAEAWRENLPAV
ncbi:FGGY-family carbohydrate kinase [Martelella endophytica]|uniref:Carbohydrate kinase n=1 Tax=Martelella endophytica TaxID=1486262 RepID=A0A0D5LN01_MAREN|nr:FGGY-family carbohydrate kinase [Martelella endophytica]AJY45506.1 carbohydrate kinase [Martelella endophytica]